MHYQQDGATLNIFLTDSLLDHDLRTIPPKLKGVMLDKATLYDISLRQPKEFTRISRVLSRWPIVTGADAANVVQYLASGRTLSIVDPTSGIFRELLDKFQTSLGLHRVYALTFNSGTNALNAAYRALGLERGDLVAAVGYTFHATVTPILELGGNPVLMDVSPIDGNVTYDIVKNVIERYPTTKIVAVNHNWGMPIQDIGQIRDLLKHHSIALLEDCSHAHGAKVSGMSVGSFGDVAVFSLQANKNLTAGEGAICLTDDVEINSRMLLVGHEDSKEATHNFPIDPSLRETALHGLQFRMHPLAGALALSQLERLHEVLEYRRANFEYLREGLRDIHCIRFPDIPENCTSAYYRLRVSYLPEENEDRSVQEYVKLLQHHGLDLSVDKSGPLSRKAVYQRHFAEYGSHALPNRIFYQPDDFLGIQGYCNSRIVFPVFSRAPNIIRGVLDVMITHIRRCTGKNQ